MVMSCLSIIAEGAGTSTHSPHDMHHHHFQVRPVVPGFATMETVCSEVVSEAAGSYCGDPPAQVTRGPGESIN